MIALTQRSDAPELMDGDNVSQADFKACMDDLARVNTATLARRPTLDFIDRALRSTEPDHVLCVVDIGFGAGDMLRALHRLAERRGRAVRLIGLDINPRSQPAASAATPPEMAIDYRTGDFADWPIEDPVDIVISSLVTHHMDEKEILGFLRWMESRTRMGWLINDLHRHWLPYYGFAALSTVMRWHRFVRHDGPISIARAFTRQDWQRLLKKSGLGPEARIAWWFPFRYCVERLKP